MERILVTGANGQIGSELVSALGQQYGGENVLATDLKPPSTGTDRAHPFEVLDVLDQVRLEQLVETYEIDTVIHLASLLSAVGEKKPDQTWEVNLGGLKNVLDLAREEQLKVFWPSSIAVFGASTPKNGTPQTTILDPTTMYGVTKVSGELLCQYYHHKFGVDVRSVRYPGLISYQTKPGGGTTDYAVEIFYAAAEGESYTCFVRPDTRLPMMYMPDAIQAVLALMQADASQITVRTSYNLSALSFSAEELAAEIEQRVPGFACRYEPDERQEIADTWPSAIDDAQARADWGWQHDYDLPTMVEDMLEHLAREDTLEV